MNDRGEILKPFPQPACHGKIEVPTDKEREALEAMRKIKERVRHLKGQFNEYDGTEDNKNCRAIHGLKKEMARLRAEWDEWEEKRQTAAKERMVLLGHEKEE